MKDILLMLNMWIRDMQLHVMWFASEHVACGIFFMNDMWFKKNMFVFLVT